MTIIEKIDLILGVSLLFSLLFNIFIFYYLSRKHMKVIDEIVYHREFTNDNFIHQAMRICQYLVLIFVSRNRKQWPLDVQDKILALDRNFRRPFLLLLLNFVLFLFTVLFTEILECSWCSWGQPTIPLPVAN